jgi:hypothetical protein
MDTETLLWNIGGVVLGVAAAFGTIYLLKVSEEFFVWVKKKSDSKNHKE